MPKHYRMTTDGSEKKRYLHHYNFPPYGGETKPQSPGRREIGHGALLASASSRLPPKEDFPHGWCRKSFSNGSTSMGFAGSTLALNGCWVPISKPVSGAAMGLIKEENEVCPD